MIDGQHVMAGPTEFQLQKLWNAGVPLAKAWLTFAHPDLKARWNEAARESAFGSLTDALENLEEQDMPAHERLLKTIAPANAVLKAKADLKKEMQANVLQYVKAKKLFAYGFEPPRRMASIPFALPVSAMGGRLDWSQSKISHEGLVFVEVRLTTHRDWNAICGKGDLTQSTQITAKGRPSVGPHIVDAAKALLQEDKINPNRSAKSHFPLIRSWLVAHAKDMPVPAMSLNDETIRQYFAPIFNDLEKTNKQ